MENDLNGLSEFLSPSSPIPQRYFTCIHLLFTLYLSFSLSLAAEKRYSHMSTGKMSTSRKIRLSKEFASVRYVHTESNPTRIWSDSPRLLCECVYVRKCVYVWASQCTQRMRKSKFSRTCACIRVRIHVCVSLYFFAFLYFLLFALTLTRGDKYIYTQ